MNVTKNYKIQEVSGIKPSKVDERCLYKVNKV